MRRTIVVAALFALCLGALPAGADDLGGAKTLLCSVRSVSECSQEGPCTGVTPESVSLPLFLKIDLAGKSVMPAKPTEGSRRSEIKSVDRIGGRLILQGSDGGPEEEKRSMGWTASISEETGKLVLSVAGTDVGFVIFGACLAL